MNFVEVIDYKDGRGFVRAEENPQLTSYGGGAPKALEYRLSIVQPKTNPVVRYEEVDRSVLEQRMQKLSDAATATDDPDAPLIPGEWCRFCKHADNCDAKENEALAQFATIVERMKMIDFDFMSVDPTTLDAVKLAEIADLREPVNAAFDRIDAEIQRRIEAGEQVPRYGMKPGRGSNNWNPEIDEEELVKKLKAKRLKIDDIYPRKLASPAQILKNEQLTATQKKKIQEELVVKTPGQLKLTRVADSEPNFLPTQQPAAQPVSFI